MALGGSTRRRAEHLANVFCEVFASLRKSSLDPFICTVVITDCVIGSSGLLLPEAFPGSTHKAALRVDYGNASWEMGDAESK